MLFTMLNTEVFISRLEQIMENHGLTASAFADKVGIQRSSLSHLMSGRNNPSLDLVMKIVGEFPEADLYWLLMGVGSYPKQAGAIAPPSSVGNDRAAVASVANDLFSDLPENRPEEIHPQEKTTTASREIERIIIFYNDGTFGEYRPN